MAYDEELAARVREVVAGEPGLTEQRMFGGLAFLVDGSMAVGASGEGGLMVRTDPADVAPLLAPPHVRPMEMGGRSMKGWLLVSRAALTDDETLRSWVARGVERARSLPPKR